MFNPDVMAYFSSPYRDWCGQVLLTNSSILAQSYRIPCLRTQNPPTVLTFKKMPKTDVFSQAFHLV